VQTTVNGLRAKVLRRTFVDVWSDWKKTVKRPQDFEQFKKLLKGNEIVRVWRRAKNVLMDLSGGYTLLVHQKMTGHLLVGHWKMQRNRWISTTRGPMDDRMNGYLHLMFFLDDGTMIALSDLRKFAKVELWKTEELLNSRDFNALGPEPLEKNFTFENFAGRLEWRKGRIKQAIMDPLVIAGVGNIYASEALWQAKIHPERLVTSLNIRELEDLHAAIKKVLAAGIKFGGESFSDYRNVNGEPGKFSGQRAVYRREGLPCNRCHTPIKRIMFGGRSAFYCPKCQIL
ncbi:MAG: DNA-formamidopyrimidine glycosylase, partial [Candidatus Saccharimonadales bacterium]